MPIVNGLAEQYGDRMNFDVVSTTAPGAAEQIERYGFDQHGMVVTTPADEVLWKEEGHMMKQPAVQAKLDELLQR